MHEARSCASAYERNGEILLVPVSGATGVAVPAVTRVSASASARELGAAVPATLRTSVSTATPAAENAALVAKSAGFPSWKALEKVGPLRRVQLVPLRRVGRGFVANRGDPVHATRSDNPTEIGERLRESLELAPA
jgi:hypothetical protein